MALIEPFRALRYAPHLADVIADVIAPPYDVISPELQQQLHARHPANFIRLEYGQDTHDADRYAHAGATLDEWTRDGTLVRDDTPAYYVYEQTFTLPDGVDAPDARAEYRRRAVFAAVGLEPWGGTIHPHEKTLAGPKKDRLQLMAATRANLSPVFAIASDPDRSIDKALGDAAGRGKLLYDGTDSQGQTHRLWRADGAVAADLRQKLDGASLTIADGHHRYETALAYRDQARADAPSACASESVMMSIVSSQSDELIILPAYRLLSGLAPDTIASLPKRLAEGGHGVDEAPTTAGTDDVDAMLAAVRAEAASTFGLSIAGGRSYTVARPASSGTGADLDVAYLHERLLPEYLGVDTNEPSGQAHVRYTVSRDHALNAVRSGEAQAAVFVRGVTMAEVERVARSGGTMPQKSTYFYPKMPSGLVARRLDD